jgi:transcription initiation factor TFIID subunit TAF12
VSLARNNLKNFIFVLLQESASKLEQQMQQIDKEKCNLQEENQKLLQQNDFLTVHYKSMLQASKLESINLFHQLLSRLTKMNSNINIYNSLSLIYMFF